MGILKKLGKAVGKAFGGTGKGAAKRAQRQANQFAAEASAARAVLEQKARKEKSRAQKLAIRGLRSRRAASHFAAPGGKATTYGDVSTTIG